MSDFFDKLDSTIGKQKQAESDHKAAKRESEEFFSQISARLATTLETYAEKLKGRGRGLFTLLTASTYGLSLSTVTADIGLCRYTLTLTPAASNLKSFSQTMTEKTISQLPALHMINPLGRTSFLRLIWRR
ncbi:hypothetical protein K6X13_20590 [Xanthomonas euvesicatoria pv. allii]|uniref:hypothetical protein n=1 Tax=Xanthomonas euvesicatoria TaxID=456327 RepID=UPI002406973B|nr:hypothetical protein [Xanthomonas euvesicatoria]MCP3049471.1 hypothetical protein [Xanthomonas euvesicatoria pv. allii]